MTVASEVRRMYLADQDIEIIIHFLRSSGVDKVDSVKLMVKELGMPLESAHSVIHNSPTWQDRQQNDEALQELFLESLESEYGKDSRQTGQSESHQYKGVE